MNKRILMLGAGFMQGVAIRSAKDRGWEVVAVDGNPQAVCAGLADHFEPIDLKDKEKLASFALRLQGNGGLDGVFTAATDFSASVAYVAKVCGLPGHSYESALNASDKLRMRQCFASSGVPSPSFFGVSSANRAETLELMMTKGIVFPVVVKPVDNMGARGCRMVLDKNDLEPAINDAIKYSRSGFAIVEEYMDGPEFSVEALVFDREIHMTGLADRHIYFPPYFIEMGHTIPTNFPEREMRSLIEIFKKGVMSLGLSHGAAKGDLKLTPKGPMIGEIAGRLSGGYMSGWTFPYSSGIDLTGSALELAVGLRPSGLDAPKKWTSAERAWISIPGKVSSISGYDKARSIPFVRDVFPRAGQGDTVAFPLNNVEKCGNCLAAAPDRTQAIKAAEDACRSVVIRLEANNQATDAFISNGPQCSTSFPPDAFSVPDINFLSNPQSVSLSENLVSAIPVDIIPFLDTATDWQGRSLRQCLLQACELEPGLRAVLADNLDKRYVLCWKALLRGGIQGIVYIYDSK